jgi:serine phosphatase RsbU (regulator of sigma subunit)/DNA-binding NarL/FixJ family response regulator
MSEVPVSSSKPIRVMLVDDHAVVRSGLSGFILAFDDLELAGEASNGEEALRLCEQVKPDVILMDLVMPVMDGAAATRAIRRRCPHIQIIALTSFKEKELVQGALDAGAIGYLLKSVSVEELADAIRAAYAGRPTLSPEVARILTQAETMERLVRAILDAPPDASTLTDLLLDNIPEMLPNSCIEIKVFPDQTLLHYPTNSPPATDLVWDFIRTSSETNTYTSNESLPWGEKVPSGTAMMILPILDTDSDEPIGGILISQNIDQYVPSDVLPVAKTVAAQIASALHSAQIHARTVEHEKITRELALAGQIQASFLPHDAPNVQGFQFAVTLEPARETAGDFYDFIALPNDKLGIVIADVADKGMGAALYMALSRSLIRTFASENPTNPEQVFAAVNRRILSDTRAGLFITSFYAILDPIDGTLTYCNAGHNPPYLIHNRKDGGVQYLAKTGMVLGIVDEATWEQHVVQLDVGDVLLLYTDGVTDAQNKEKELFGEKRLLEVAQANMGRSAGDIQKALITQVLEFVGSSPQFDDITLIVIVKGE